ncbi:MAG: hypothetical protein DMD86_16940, partial [Candidatus Rokuibacteriota bacterium]
MTRRPRRSWEASGWWGQPPLWSRVRQTARANPARLAVADDHGQDHYGDLWAEGLRHAEALRRSGVGRGDIVLAQLPNWREFVRLAVGAETAGVVLAFCPVHWGLRETVGALALIRPRLWFTTTAPGQDADRTEIVQRALGALEGSSLTVVVRSREAPAGTIRIEDWLADAERPSP